mmetsp:Transcript_77966/g.137481  ORF Transcript_77966/g.137481 Transcript_77966/m.137481 type:complete len:332 (-) Transcript_77966:59-1054(-)
MDISGISIASASSAAPAEAEDTLTSGRYMQMFILKHRQTIARWYGSVFVADKITFRKMVRGVMQVQSQGGQIADHIRFIYQDWISKVMVPSAVRPFLVYVTQCSVVQREKMRHLVEELSFALRIKAPDMVKAAHSPRAGPEKPQRSPTPAVRLESLPNSPVPSTGEGRRVPGEVDVKDIWAAATALMPREPIASRKFPNRNLLDGMTPYAKGKFWEHTSPATAEQFLPYDSSKYIENRASTQNNLALAQRIYNGGGPPYAKLLKFINDPSSRTKEEFQPISKEDHEKARKTTKVQNYNKFLEDQHRGVMPAGLKLDKLREYANRPRPPVTP